MDDSSPSVPRVSASALFDLDVDVPAISRHEYPHVTNTGSCECMSCGNIAPTFIVSGQPLVAEEDSSNVIWALFCDRCADKQSLRYYYPRGQREYFVSETTEQTKFPAAHNGVTRCSACMASGKELLVVYDEVCDEFLVCNNCRKMRQQLRVWNKFQDVLIDDLKPPVVLSKEYLELETKRQDFFAENRMRVLSGLPMLPLPDWPE